MVDGFSSSNGPLDVPFGAPVASAVGAVDVGTVRGGSIRFCLTIVVMCFRSLKFEMFVAV